MAGSAKMPVMHRLPQISPALLLSALMASKPAASPPEYFYGYTRHALEDALILLGLQAGDEVLYPDYICDVTLAPCRRLGLAVRFYPVLDDFQPDWKVLEDLLSPRSRVILLVHYFGFPQDLARWRHFAQTHGLQLVEDNAHGFGSLVDGQQLGATGDLALIGLRKVLPLLNGSILRINNPELAAMAAAAGLPRRFRGHWGKNEVRNLARLLPVWFRGFIQRWRRTQLYETMPASEEDQFFCQHMAGLSRRLMAVSSPQLPSYRRRRQEIYWAWAKFTAMQRITPVFGKLPDGVSPQVFPGYLDDPARRGDWLRWARRHGVDLHPWPGLPLAVRTVEPVKQRWLRLLCFPVQQDLTVEQIQQLPLLSK